MKYVRRLEEALDLWECFCAYVSAKFSGTSKACLLKGPFKHWHELRRHLIEGPLATADGAIEIDKEKRFQPAEDDHHFAPLLGETFDIPILLENWIRSSRRVYHVKKDLHFLLRRTSLKEISWSDVHFPFPSFILDLEEEIIDEEGKKYDCIMVCMFGDINKRDVQWLWIKPLCQDLSSPLLLEYAERKEIADYIRNGKVKALQRILRQVDKRFQKSNFKRQIKVGETFMLRMDSIGNSLVTDSISQLNVLIQKDEGREYPISTKHDSFFTELSRLVVGLCLYFKSLPASTRHLTKWTPIIKSSSSDLNPITRESEVCTVSSIFELTHEEASEFSKRCIGHEVAAHFREGFWRRPKGKGHIPEALRTIWVRPTIVRKDKVKEGHLPLGAKKIISDQDRGFNPRSF